MDPDATAPNAADSAAANPAAASPAADPPAAETLHTLHRDVDTRAAKLQLLHADALQCRRGCHDCCADDITVFEVEAQRIRDAHPQLLQQGAPHPPGKCAFLDAEGACRIYDDRPYVCRTQGLPLRWLDEHEGALAEFRDICPLNDEHLDLTALPEQACWTIGPTEGRLRAIQQHKNGSLHRISLRALFRTPLTPQ